MILRYLVFSILLLFSSQTQFKKFRNSSYFCFLLTALLKNESHVDLQIFAKLNQMLHPKNYLMY